MSAEPERATVSVIRPMRLEDVAAVSAILRKSPQAANWNSQSLVEALQWPGAVNLVSESAGAVTGFVMARQTAEDAEILNIAVMPSARRQGIGQALLKAVTREFTALKVKNVFLEVRDSNAAAIRFYQQAGFTQIGKRPKYYSNPEEACLLMETKLTA